MSGLHMFIAYTLPELKRKIIVKSDFIPQILTFPQL